MIMTQCYGGWFYPIIVSHTPTFLSEGDGDGRTDNRAGVTRTRKYCSAGYQDCIFHREMHFSFFPKLNLDETSLRYKI